MISMGTRRVGDNVWVRTTECVLPNVQQIAPVWNDGKGPDGFDGPMMTRWIVPRDDTSTMLLELRHISEAEEREPAWWLDREQMLPAQLPESDILREQQLQPSDYEAQVSQRPVAIHGLEHLGATDRGVTMFRRQLRRGIRAVQAGDELGDQGRDENGHISTFCIDTAVPMPPAATREEDTKQMRELGLRKAAEYINNPPHK
jgi:hypothetical protein